MGDDAGRAPSGPDARPHSSDWIDHAVRVGLVAYGVVHLMIAWLALQLALGDQRRRRRSTGRHAASWRSSRSARC